MAQTKAQKIIRFAGISVLVLVAVAFLGYWLAVRPLQARNQKQNFDKAESQIDALAEQIQQTIGRADETKKEKTCGYASQVYGRGRRSCGVTLSLFFTGKNLAQSNDALSLVSKVVGGLLYEAFGRSDRQNFTEHTNKGLAKNFHKTFLKILRILIVVLTINIRL